MLGVRFGYYTTDPATAWEIDSLLDYFEENLNDILGAVGRTVFGAEKKDSDDADVLAYFDKMISFLNERLERHGQEYIGGTNNLTIADLKVMQGITLILEGANPCPAEIKDQCREKIAAKPKVEAYLNKLKSDIQRYLDVRDPTPL